MLVKKTATLVYVAKRFPEIFGSRAFPPEWVQGHKKLVVQMRKDKIISHKKIRSFHPGCCFSLSVWLIRRRRADTAGLSDWQRTLARRYGAKKAQSVGAAVRRQHASLVAETPMPENKAFAGT